MHTLAVKIIIAEGRFGSGRFQVATPAGALLLAVLERKHHLLVMEGFVFKMYMLCN